MANPSHYIRLLAPARWHLAEVSVEGCPPSGEGSFPRARPVPEHRLSHCARMSAHNNPRQPLSLVSARHIGFPPRRAGAQLELLHTGCAQISCGRLVFASPRAHGPRGCCLSAPTPGLPGRSSWDTAPPDAAAGPGNRLAGLCCGVFKRKQAPAQETSTAAEGMGLRG